MAISSGWRRTWRDCHASLAMTREGALAMTMRRGARNDKGEWRIPAVFADTTLLTYGTLVLYSSLVWPGQFANSGHDREVNSVEMPTL